MDNNTAGIGCKEYKYEVTIICAHELTKEKDDTPVHKDDNGGCIG
jgi:hypothetical protein